MLGQTMNMTVTRNDLQATASDLMTSPESATYLCISKGTLRHWVTDRKIEFLKLGRVVRFRKAHLDRFISQRFQEKNELKRHGISQRLFKRSDLGRRARTLFRRGAISG